MAKQYGPWETIERLGEGGQGVVQLVRDTRTSESKHYVLKRLKDLNRLERFRREVKTGLSLAHEGILRIYDFELGGKKPYYVAEYCPQGDLSRNAHVLEWPLTKKLRLFEKVCTAVGHAHEAGVVHRDLKPENILLRSDEEPVVADFGICFIADGDRITLTDDVMGARHYTSPEVESGRMNDVQPSADVYSLGKILYWLLSGRDLPREQHKGPRFDLRKQKEPSLFLVYEELFDRAITTLPDNRFPNASELGKAAQRLREQIEAGARPLTFDAPQPCMFCRRGEYREAISSRNIAKTSRPGFWTPDQLEQQVRAIGFSTVGEPSIMIVVCDYCGNVQLFRPDKGKNPSAWNLKNKE